MTQTKKLYDLDVEPMLADAAVIEPAFLQEEFIRVPQDIVYWGHRRATAARDFLIAKRDVAIAEARADQTHRTVSTIGNVRATEAQIKNAVAVDPRVHAAKQRMIDAETQKLKLEAVCEGLRAKRDMLVQLGADVRAQMIGDPSIRSEVRQQSTFREHQRRTGAKVDESDESTESNESDQLESQT